MISYKDEKTKRELIMKHYSQPENKKEELNPNFIQHYKHSSSCVDEITLALEIKEEKVLNTEFIGKGCAVFLASTDLFLNQIKNKNLLEVKDIIKNYQGLINRENTDEEKIGPLVIFHNVKVHLNRLECAKLISEAVSELINKI